jgi:hypothetical protein
MNVGSEDLTLGDIDQDISLKESNKNIFNARIDSFGKEYKCLIAARKAYTQDSRPHLFILAIHDDKEKCKIEDKEKCEIYVITFNPPDWIYINDTETIEGQMKDTEIKEVLSKYKNKVMKNLRDHALSKKDAEDIGKTLFETLIPDKIKTELQNELKNESEKVERWVWIYSDDDVFNPIWEWLYTSPKPPNNTKKSNVANQKPLDKNSSSWLRNPFRSKKRALKTKNKLLQESTMRQVKENNKEDGFFWGDRFFLCRVSKKDEFKKLPFNINKVADIVINKNCSSYAYDYSLKLHEILSTVVPKRLKLQDLLSSNTNQLHPQVYLGVDVSDIHEGTEIHQLNSIFLFLNVFSSKKTDLTSNHRSKLINRISAKTMMYPSFIIPKSFANTFLIPFCNCIITEKNVVKAATKTREIIRQDNDGNLWRLVYIVEGNPFTEAER